MTLSFANVFLPTPNRELADWIEERISLKDVVEFALHSWHGPRRDRWPWLGLLPPRPIRLSTLYFPCDASRFATAHFVVSSSQLTQIYNKPGGTTWTPFTLKMEDGNSGHTINATMYMLPPRPLAQVSGVQSPYQQLYLLTLVDARFAWWGKTADIVVEGGTTTWANMYTSVGSALGLTVNYTAIDAAYLKPSEELTARYEFMPFLLDALAVNTGLRIVVGLDGTVTAQSPAEALVLHNLQRTKWSKQGGGLFDQAPPLPTTAKIVFPVVDALGIPTGGIYVGTQATGAQPSYTGSRGWHDSAASDGTNDAELNALTSKFTADWVAWQQGQQSTNFAGIVPYTPEGLTDYIEWTYSAEKCGTFVSRGPFNHINQQLNHHGTAGEINIIGPGLYNDGEDVIIPDLTSDTVTANDVIISNSLTTLDSATVTFINTVVTWVDVSLNTLLKITADGYIIVAQDEPIDGSRLGPCEATFYVDCTGPSIKWVIKDENGDVYTIYGSVTASIICTLIKQFSGYNGSVEQYFGHDADGNCKWFNVGELAPGDACASAAPIEMGVTYGPFELAPGEHWFKIEDVPTGDVQMRLINASTTVDDMDDAMNLYSGDDCSGLVFEGSLGGWDGTPTSFCHDNNILAGDFWIQVKSVAGTLTYEIMFDTGTCT